MPGARRSSRESGTVHESGVRSLGRSAWAVRGAASGSLPADADPSPAQSSQGGMLFRVYPSPKM